MRKAANWFEISVSDLDRATRFYEKVMDAPLKRDVSGGGPLSIFPYEAPGIGGALVPNKKNAGGAGAVVYLNAEGKLDAWIERVSPAGGEVVQQKTAVGPHGFIALIRDSEGNTVGLHSQK